MKDDRKIVRMSYKSLDVSTGEAVVIDEVVDIGIRYYSALVKRFASSMLEDMAQLDEADTWYAQSKVGRGVKTGKTLWAFREYSKNKDTVTFNVSCVSRETTSSELCLIANIVNDALMSFMSGREFIPTESCHYWFSDGLLYVSIPKKLFDIMCDVYGNQIDIS